MKNDELLDQRLHEWSCRHEKIESLDSVDMATRLRDLRLKRIKRRRVVMASSSLLLLGFGITLLMSKLRTNESGLSQPIASIEHPTNSDVEIPNQELLSEWNSLKVEVEESQWQTELLIMDLRVEQAIAQIDRAMRECNRKELREQQASQWLVAIFRELSAEGTH